MANNTPSDDFLEQILGFPNYNSSAQPGADAAAAPMMLQLGSAHIGAFGGGEGYPLGLSLEQSNIGGYTNDASASGKRTFLRDDVVSSSVKQAFHAQPLAPAGPQPPAIRPRIRARRGQATDPHSIAERLRRERIAERIRALQELVPIVNKTDRAAMLDEIVDYVKFLRLQVKVLSMSRLGAAGAVAPLVTDIPIIEDEEDENGRSHHHQPAWEKWSNDGTERQVAKLMEENVGAAMQFLQSKALCIMPISLASAIYHTQQHSPPDVKPDPQS